MTAYLGPAGNLVEFACPSDEQIGLGDRVKLRTTVDGTQQAQYTRKSPRAWQVGIGTATPDQVAQLNALAYGLYGPPPWVYVGPWAQVTNLLPPAASMLLPGSWVGAGTAGGTVSLEGGFHPASSVKSANGAELVVPTVPVTPGIPVTGSVYAIGDPNITLRLDFRDTAGGTITTASTRMTTFTSGPLPRVVVTGVPPEGAVGVTMRTFGAIHAALPALTWTPDAAAWSVGGGAPKVVQRGLSEAVQLAVRDDRNLRRSSLSFTLEEVGNA